jgi:hypothetical protein
MRRHLALLLAAIVPGITACLVSSCERPVELSRASLEILAIDGGLSGFVCREPSSKEYLAQRAVDRRRVTFVVDYIALHGAPKCDSQSLEDWCSGHSCTVIGRSCFERALDATRASKSTQSVADAYARVRGERLTATVPPEPVLVRVVGTTEPCATVAATSSSPFACDALVGCAASCPVLLEGLDGPVEVNLDIGKGLLGDELYEMICSVGVEKCARVPYGSLSGDDCASADAGDAGFGGKFDGGFGGSPR